MNKWSGDQMKYNRSWSGWQKQGDLAIISQGTWPKSGNMKRRLRASKWHKLEFSIFISY